MDYSQIDYEVDEQVATITLDRPDRMNAFTTHDVRRADRRRSTGSTPTTTCGP